MDFNKNKTAQRYVEIFGEVADKYHNTLRYWGQDNKYHYLAEQDRILQTLQDVIYSMDEDVFTNGVPNITGNEAFDVTTEFDGVKMSNPAMKASGFYENTLIPDEDEDAISITNVVVVMGGVEITNSCTTKNVDHTVSIYIPKVTGAVSISALGKA